MQLDDVIEHLFRLQAEVQSLRKLQFRLSQRIDGWQPVRELQTLRDSISTASELAGQRIREETKRAITHILIAKQPRLLASKRARKRAKPKRLRKRARK